MATHVVALWLSDRWKDDRDPGFWVRRAPINLAAKTLDD
jgi:hypothetical protein